MDIWVVFMTHAAVDIPVKFLYGHRFLFLLDVCLGAELIFEDLQPFSKMALPFYNPTSTVKTLKNFLVLNIKRAQTFFKITFLFQSRKLQVLMTQELKM